jgi:hypothetical protein
MDSPRAEQFRVLVCGPRDFPSPFRVYCVVLGLVREFWRDAGYHLIIVHGAARGVDLMADYAAYHLGIPTEPHPADWSKGKSAGFQRNIEMLEVPVQLVVAVGTGKGTQHTINEAHKRGIEVRRKSAWWIGASAR